jgi:hypothetical protein
MKRITSIVTGSLVAALFASGALTINLNAQNEPGEIFMVPFAFTADGHNVEAGTYEVNLVSNQYLMSIRNVKTGDEQVFNVLPEQRRAIASQGLLVFHDCGRRKELTEFHIPGTNLYSATVAPRHTESSQLESCTADDTTTIAAR